MYRAREVQGRAVVAERLRAAHTHWTRLRGLLGTSGLTQGEGLWLKPCRQVHMMGMRYPLDIVFLDGEHRVVRTVHELAPWRLSPRVPEATSVLELPAGTVARLGLVRGARIEIAGVPEPASGVSVQGVAAVLCNFALAALYVFFVAAHFGVGRRTGQWATIVPILLQESLLVVLFLTRRRSIANSTRVFDWVVGIVGLFLPLGLRATDDPSSLTWLGEPLQVVGLCLAIAAVGSLGRSIGVVAANRGVKTSGLYRQVRHPMYSAHLLGYAGYLLSYQTPRNGLIVALTVLALSARAVVEERFLARDAAYRDYLARVRWRFVPYVY